MHYSTLYSYLYERAKSLSKVCMQPVSEYDDGGGGVDWGIRRGRREETTCGALLQRGEVSYSVHSILHYVP